MEAGPFAMFKNERNKGRNFREAHWRRPAEHFANGHNAENYRLMLYKQWNADNMSVFPVKLSGSAQKAFDKLHGHALGA